MNDKRIKLGIDLGTTYSAAAYVDEHGDARIIPNSENERITPSVVFFESENNIIVGQRAKEEIEISPEQVVSHIKREMGKKKDEVRKEYNNGNPKPYEFFGKVFSPEEISALILKKLKKDAEAHFQGEEIKDAVITVPAYFSDAERQATKDAGTMAGFNVLQVINEPTAAAIAYGISKSADESQKVFVFDLGGGTFDVTILDVRINKGNREINIVNSDGDHRLGGKDWDDLVIDYIADEFIKEHGEDPRKNIDTMARLRSDSERIKKTLSDKESARVAVTTDSNNLKMEITREKFEELTLDLMIRIQGLCNHVFNNTGLEWSDIDTVLLAGGATRMPMVKNMLGKLSGKAVRTDLINPDECVALGAALQAAITTMNDDKEISQEIRDKLGNITVRDVTSHTIGTVVWSDIENKEIVVPMIKKGTPVPYSHTEKFVTRADYQKAVKIEIVEGESTIPGNCTTILEGELQIVNPMPKGAPIQETHTLSIDGILTVKATDLTNNKELVSQVDRKGNLSSEEIKTGSEYMKSINVE